MYQYIRKVRIADLMCIWWTFLVALVLARKFLIKNTGAFKKNPTVNNIFELLPVRQQSQPSCFIIHMPKLVKLEFDLALK